MRREKIFGLLILAMILMFQTSLMAQNKREFRGAWIQCVNGQRELSLPRPREVGSLC